MAHPALARDDAGMRIASTLSLLVACAAPARVATAPATPVAACASPEHRQLDFWVGSWDVAIRARSAPMADTWAEAKGTQRVEAVLGGCAIAEHFEASGPQQPWAGRSYSSWQPALGKWRQTWVDDQGSYLAFTGGVEDGTFVLYGEPFEASGKQVQMRMAFRDVTADSIHWVWERTVDGGATWSPSLIIDYRRAERR